MGSLVLTLGLLAFGQIPPLPGAPESAAPADFASMAGPADTAPAASAPGLDTRSYFTGTNAPTAVSQPFDQTRMLFQSDHAFDGFTGPLSNPVQFKDPRSLTEARFLFMNNWAQPGTPVIGSGGFQVYALQLRLALNERIQLFADKDGIVRLSPKPGSSVTGLANLAAGAKFVLIRDVEHQFLASAVVQYEVPTGTANIFQNQGSGLLSAYMVLGKEWGDWHTILQFGQTTRLNVADGGYFLTAFHIDRRFGPFTPFYEANWMYYNMSGNFLPASVGIEGGGWLMLHFPGDANSYEARLSSLSAAA